MQGIYARYLAGGILQRHHRPSERKGPPYDADKPWNKNMVRVFWRTTATPVRNDFGHPLPEQLQEAAQRRSERSLRCR